MQDLVKRSCQPHLKLWGCAAPPRLRKAKTLPKCLANAHDRIPNKIITEVETNTQSDAKVSRKKNVQAAPADSQALEGHRLVRVFKIVWVAKK